MMVMRQPHAEYDKAPQINFREGFRFGRSTALACDLPPKALPDAEESCGDVDRVFLQNLGLSRAQAAALMGGHALGRMERENLGYEGWWDTPEKQTIFSSHYYKSLLLHGWYPQKAVGGDPNKNQWKLHELELASHLPPNISDVDKTTLREAYQRAKPIDKEIAMLNSDVCLVWSFVMPDGEKTTTDARTQNCCAWLPVDSVKNWSITGEYCSTGHDVSVVQSWDLIGPKGIFVV